jgi:hypothetical protein
LSLKKFKTLGIRYIEKLFDDLFDLIWVNELTNVENKIEKEMNVLLKSPQNVVELATQIVLKVEINENESLKVMKMSINMWLIFNDFVMKLFID